MDNSNTTELPVQPEELAQQAWLEERAAKLAAQERAEQLELLVATLLLVLVLVVLAAGLAVARLTS